MRELGDELARRHAELEAEASAADAREAAGAPADDQAQDVAMVLKGIEREQKRIERALAEVARCAPLTEATPAWVPLTDPESRVTKNKEGGFAPNYTPLAGVDVQSGLIVTADVIANTDEERHLLPAIDAVGEDYGVAVEEALADDLFATGANLEGLEQRRVTLYSPAATIDPAKNPALREDPTQPVPQEQYDRLPVIEVKPKNAAKQKQLAKSAFVYDSARDCYWRPNGQPMTYKQTTTDKRSGKPVKRRRYQASPGACDQCPLRGLCMQSTAKTRQVSRDEHEAHREELARRMDSDEGKEKYAERRSVGERRYAESRSVGERCSAAIKQQFGVRQFLLRGLKKVRIEWRWLAVAHNLRILMRGLANAARAGPSLAADA